MDSYDPTDKLSASDDKEFMSIVESIQNQHSIGSNSERNRSGRSKYESLDNAHSVKEQNRLNQVEQGFLSHVIDEKGLQVSEFLARSGSQDKRHGNSDYICFNIEQMKFFCLTDKFTANSRYFQRFITQKDKEHSNKERAAGCSLEKPQIELTLADETCPSVFL